MFVEGDFVFASRTHATLKADAERLYDHPRQLAVVVGHFAAYPCVQEADALLYVPDGMRKLLPPERMVHSLAMLLRGTVNPQYQAGLVDHYLLERKMPTDKHEFRRRLASDDWL